MISFSNKMPKYMRLILSTPFLNGMRHMPALTGLQAPLIFLYLIAFFINKIHVSSSSLNILINDDFISILGCW